MHDILVFIYFVYIQILPITHDSVQLVILSIIIATTLWKFIIGLSKKKALKVSKNYFALKLIIINSLLFTLFGFIANRPGAEEFLFLETIFPLIYLAIFSTGNSDKMIRNINLCFTISTFIIGVLFIIQVLNFTGGIDFMVSLNDSSEIEGTATTDGTITGLRFIPLYSLSYLTSISLHNLASSINNFLSKAQAQSQKKKDVLRENFLIIIHLFNFSSTLFCIILSGRQGLIVGFVSSISLIVIIQIVVSTLSFNWKNKSMKYVEKGGKHIRFILSTIVFFIVLILLVNNFVEFVKIDYGYIQNFLEKNGGDMERIGQFSALADAWSDSPIIGHGNGSTVPFVRDLGRPWRYELGYMTKLNNMGLLGISLYFFGIALICTSLIKNFYKTGKIVYISSLGGLFSLLVADGTNPYMVRFTVLYYLYYCLWLSMNKEDSFLEKS
jgi:hypothetical protein